MLTDREKEITQLAANGLSSKEIGNLLGVSKRTVEAHLRASRIKLKANNTTHLVSIAHRTDLIASLFLACTISSSFVFDDALRPSRVRGRITRITKQLRGRREWFVLP